MLKISKEDFLFIPLGGSGEIGMNCNLYHFDNSWIMIDLGVMFGNSNISSNELIMPNLDFIHEREINLDALILTHAHEDHIGAVPYLYEKLNKLPIYTTSFSASVLKRKFLSNGFKDFDIRLLDYNKKISIGSFSVEILALTHSIPEPNAIILRTKALNLFHTGDWKIDPTPLVGEPIDTKKLQSLNKEGMEIMICDSTNVFDENPSGSENDVRITLRDIFSKKKKGKIIITCFASNIARLETIIKVSNEFNKCCVFLGRSIHRIYDSAKENNYLSNLNNIISEKESISINDDDIVIICTGSQGESNAALSRLVDNKNKFFEIMKTDLVIFSSRVIPGNEKKINELNNKLLKKGCDIINSKNLKVHVSGHPSRKELKQMYSWISPNTIIPVHGEYKHLNEHAKFAKNVGIKNQIIVENGNVVLLKKNNSKIINNVKSGKLLLKGNQIFPQNDNLINNARIVSSEGEIFVNLILDLEKKLLNDPIIFCPTVTENVNLINQLKDVIKEELQRILNSSITDEVIGQQLKIIIKSFIKKNIGLKPLTYIEIVRI